jgi:hypothetical protein
MCKQKNPILVHFGGHGSGKFCSFYGNLFNHFVLPFWYTVPIKIWQPWSQPPSVEYIDRILKKRTRYDRDRLGEMFRLGSMELTRVLYALYPEF